MRFLDQSQRRFRVEVVEAPDLTAKFVAERFSGRETLSRDFHFEVELLSEHRDIDHDEVRGRMMALWLRLPDGGERPFTGLVKHFEYLDSHPRGIHRYRAQLVPWLDYARLRRNCRIHLQTLREEQIRETLRDYGAVARWDWRILGEQRRYPMCVQFNETDFNFMKFRLEHDGASTHFEHDGQGHTWVVRATTLDAEPISGPSPEVRFHADEGSGVSMAQHSITRWGRCSEWGHRTELLSSYDFKTARASQASVPTLNDTPDVLPLQNHEFVGNWGYTDSDDGQRLAVLRIEETEVRRRLVSGHSTNPWLAAGRWFRLTGHPACAPKPEDNEYLVNDIRYEAKNNFLHDPGEPPSFSCRFVAHPRHIAWRPGRGWHSSPNIVSVLQTATVVGRDGIGPVDVDEYGRILVRFHWDPEGFSCRVRVQQAWQGGEQGTLFIPRIGSEVSVAFEMGNPDSPIVLGSLPNRVRMPAWKLPSQAHLSGLRSREATAGGGNNPGAKGNHILFDDTPGKLHFQAFSSHQYSQLNLGFYCYIDGTAGRSRLRGQGIEARTDGHGVFRAAKGLLQTTDARPNADSHATDIREAGERLANAQNLHRSLADAAQAAAAHDAGDQAPVVQALEKQIGELTGSGGDPANGTFAEFQAPHMLSASAAGIQSMAEGSTHIASNQHTALTSGGHTSISAGKSLLASVKDAVRLFAYRAGMKLVSASADIDLQALKTSINLLAKLNINATADCINIDAATRLSLSGGGSNITLSSGGITHKTAGSWVAHASSFDMNGPARVGSPTLPRATPLPLGTLDVLNQYVNRAVERRVRGVRDGLFTALDADGTSHAGTLDGDGFRSVAAIPMGMAEVTYERDPSDPWDDGSYISEEAWPTPARQPSSDDSPVAALPASALQAVSQRLAEAPVQQALAAAALVQGLQQGSATALLAAAHPLAAGLLPSLSPQPALRAEHTFLPA